MRPRRVPVRVAKAIYSTFQSLHTVQQINLRSVPQVTSEVITTKVPVIAQPQVATYKSRVTKTIS